MPQTPYVPLGTLRGAVTYPLSPNDIEDGVVRKAVGDVGLGHLLDRLDEDGAWEHVCQRQAASADVPPSPADPTQS